MVHPKKRKPRSLVLSGNGLNCEIETAHANRMVGFAVDIVHISTLMEGTKSIHDYDFLNLPGGFLDGDDLGAGKAQAVKWRYQLMKDSTKAVRRRPVEIRCRREARHRHLQRVSASDKDGPSARHSRRLPKTNRHPHVQ